MASPPLSAVSKDAAVPAVTAANDSGEGVRGISVSNIGVHGESKTGRGVLAISDSDYALRAASRTMPGIRASSELGTAIEGWSKGASTGVLGLNDAGGVGAAGRSQSGTGLDGASTTGIGVNGASQNGDGVVGRGHRGVVGSSTDFQGVYGHSDTNAGVVGESQSFDGVFGVSHNPRAAGVSGHNPGGMAGFFEGDVFVTGDLILAGADYAENFDLSDNCTSEPGSVMVLDDGGRLMPSRQEYDRRVVGIVSGAGRFRPGVLLDGHGDQTGRTSLALMGKVFCRVDGSDDPISAGDLLTSSARAGTAMKATDRNRSFGAVLGKALAACDRVGLIPVLVTLQ